MKRAISLLLSLLLIFSVMSIGFSAHAKSKTYNYDNSKYYYDEDVVEYNGLFYAPVWYTHSDPMRGSEAGTYIVGYDGIDTKITLSSKEPPDVDGYWLDVEGVFSYAFDESSIKEITIKKNMDLYIDGYAFSNCKKLKKADLSGAYCIGEGAFYDCSSLGEVTFSNLLGSIDHWAFKGTCITNFYIPKNVSLIASTALDSYYTCDISVSKDNEYYSSYKGALYNKEKTKLLKYICYYTGKWPKTMVSVGTDAFHVNGQKYAVTEIKLPKKVTKLGNYAFYEVTCGELTIPGNVKTIPIYCFAESDFDYLKIPSTVKKIEVGAYYGTLIYDIDFPNSLKTIEEEAFKNIKLKGNSIITVPASVKTIGNDAFDGKYLAGYKGSAAQKFAKKNGIKFIIAPTKGTLTSVTSPKKGFIELHWKRVSGAKGYQYQISTSSTMSEKTKQRTVKGGNMNGSGDKGWKPGKTYYVQVRAYTTKKLGGKTKIVYGSWSNVKKVRIRK